MFTPPAQGAQQGTTSNASAFRSITEIVQGAAQRGYMGICVCTSRACALRIFHLDAWCLDDSAVRPFCVARSGGGQRPGSRWGRRRR